MKVTLRNDFHNTSVILYAKNGHLSRRQIMRARKELCCPPPKPGEKSLCGCSDDLGCRGPQEWDYWFEYDTRIGWDCIMGAKIWLKEENNIDDSFID